jgi:hypothetical protein
VLLLAQPPLARLMRRVAGVDAVLVPADPLPEFDFHCPLLSVPRLLGTTLTTIPGGVPYLRPDAALSARWRGRLDALPGLKVGLVWSGDPRRHDREAYVTDSRRSLRLAQLAPLAGVPGVSFVSLQKGEAAAQLDSAPAGFGVTDWMGEVGDFDDTAALAANLDLVISVDTSVAHLAGGLGRPTWVLSRYDGCWRWLLDGEDSPWYPTLRLFRQAAPLEWDPVVERVAAALVQFAALRAA